MVWIERALLAGVLVFATVRLGPQVGALLGVGPDLGRAPAYELVTLDGIPIHSDSLVGRVVVVNFWATWCGPCKLEMPALQALHEERSDQGLSVLGLSTDVGRGAAISEFLVERAIGFPVGRATNAHRMAFGGIPAIPATFLIDKHGVVRHRVVGFFAPPAMRVAVDRLLAEEGPVQGDPERADAGRADARRADPGEEGPEVSSGR